MLLYSPVFQSQNLVTDPGFEKMDYCPGKRGKNQSTLKALSEWWSPNKCAPDYMNSCAGGMDGVQNNVGGTQEPAEGEGYAGICHGRKGKYFEFIQTTLTKPLDSGKTYLVTLHVSFGDKVFYATNEIGIRLSKDKLSCNSKDVLPVDRYVPIRTGAFYISKDKWMKIQTLFQADGGERFFTIGYFNAFPELQLVGGKLPKAIDGEADDVYYFVDDVNVEEIELNGKDQPGLFKTDISKIGKQERINTLHSIRNVEYSMDGAIPLPGGFKVLDSIAGILLAEPDLQIEFYPVDKESMELCRRRNIFIRDYLIGKGINPSRVQWTAELTPGSTVAINFRWKY